MIRSIPKVILIVMMVVILGWMITPHRQKENLTISTMDVVVFFSKQNINNCNFVTPVKRKIEYTAEIVEVTIKELLEGPTQEEIDQGLLTNLPSGTALNNLTIENGVATVDFNKVLNNSAGSCRVQAIRAQITQTLLQFPIVNEVVITINGNEDEVLQP